MTRLESLNAVVTALQTDWADEDPQFRVQHTPVNQLEDRDLPEMDELLDVEDAIALHTTPGEVYHVHAFDADGNPLEEREWTVPGDVVWIPGHYIVTSDREHIGPFATRLDALDEADNKRHLDPDLYAIRHLDENGDRVSFCAPPPRYMTDPQAAGNLAKLHRMLGKNDSAEKLEAFANGGPPPEKLN